MSTRDTVKLTTPHGHEVRAEVDYGSFHIDEAKVVNNVTGVVRPLPTDVLPDLADALRAKALHGEAESRARELEHTLGQFTKLAQALGNDHPGIKPYLDEVGQHRQVAADMAQARERLEMRVGFAADHVAERHENTHLPNLKDNGPRQV